MPDPKRLAAVYAAMRWDTSNLSRTLAAFIPALVYALRPSIIVEIGIQSGFLGHAAALACDAFQPDAATIVSVDTDRGACDQSAALLQVLRVRHVVHCGPSQEAPWATLLGHAFAGLWLIDGCHDYEAVRDDLATAYRWGAPGAVVLAHDADDFPGVRQAIADSQDWHRALTAPHDPDGSVSFALLTKG